MRGGERPGDEEVLALGAAGHDGAVADGVRAVTGLVDAAFDEGVTFGADEALDVVAVERVAAEADGVRNDLVAEDVVFGHDVIADHAAGFTDINLPRPVAGVGELVFGVTPLGELLANLGGDTFIREEEVEEAFLVTDVLGDDAVAGGVVAHDVAVIATQVVDAERAEVVEVGLAVFGNRTMYLCVTLFQVRGC